MLVELSVDQTALRSEATLEVSVLVINDLQELGVVAADCELGKCNDFVGLSSEGVDRITQLGDADVAGATADYLSEIVEVNVHLICVVREVEWNQVCGCQVVCKERQIFAHRFVMVEARVAKGGHPVVRVVVAVVRVQGISWTATAAHVNLRTVSAKLIFSLVQKPLQ